MKRMFLLFVLALIVIPAMSKIDFEEDSIKACLSEETKIDTFFHADTVIQDAVVINKKWPFAKSSEVKFGKCLINEPIPRLEQKIIKNSEKRLFPALAIALMLFSFVITIAMVVVCFEFDISVAVKFLIVCEIIVCGVFFAIFKDFSVILFVLIHTALGFVPGAVGAIILGRFVAIGIANNS